MDISENFDFQKFLKNDNLPENAQFVVFLGALLFVKLRLGALIPRSVCWSVGLSVGRSVLQKLKKNYKSVQNITKRYKTFG